MTPGLPGIEGEYRFSDYGRIRAEIVSGRPLVIEDVLTDPRTADDVAGWAALSARAVVNVPVLERGRPVAILIVHHAEPHAWTDDELAFLRNAADRLEIGIARQRAEDRQAILNGEIAHRLKNSLAMVQAIANQTLKASLDRDAMEAFGRRVAALGTAHDALLGRGLKAADLEMLTVKVLDAAGIVGRYQARGPRADLGARAALSTSLLLHELATNAMKYGALSAGGSVRVDWRFDGAGDAAVLTLDWTERGGPPAATPTRKGFGSRLVRLGLVGTGGAELRYGSEGFSATFTASRLELERS